MGMNEYIQQLDVTENHQSLMIVRVCVFIYIHIYIYIYR